MFMPNGLPAQGLSLALMAQFWPEADLLSPMMPHSVLLCRDMTQFKIDPNFAHKSEDDRLLLISTEADRNEVYEFEGKASLLLLKLLDSDSFTIEVAKNICLDLKASPEDLTTLWELCVNEKIIIPLT
jgi:hypothetical protein